MSEWNSSYQSNSPGYCQVCHQRIWQAGQPYQSNQCQCQWYNDRRIIAIEDTTEKSIVAIMLFFAVALVVSFMHISNWGRHFYEAPKLQFFRVTKTLTDAGYIRLTQICRDLRKVNCAVAVSAERVAKNPSLAHEHAELLFQLGKTQDSLQAFENYFAAGHQNWLGALNYGRILEQLKMHDRAVRLYSMSIRNTPAGILPIQATAGSVRVLIKLADYQTAYQAILKFHSLGHNALGYLNSELEWVRRKMTAGNVKTVSLTN